MIHHVEEMKRLHLALLAAPDFDSDGPIADGIRDQMDGVHGPYHKMTPAESDEFGRWTWKLEYPDEVPAT